MAVQLSVKLSPKQAGNLLAKSMRLEDRVKKLETAIEAISDMSDLNDIATAVRQALEDDE